MTYVVIVIPPAGHAALTLRSRLRCIIMRKDDELNKTSKPPTSLLVLNEVVIDRGPSPYLSNIDLFLDGKHITSVQGDGKRVGISLWIEWGKVCCFMRAVELNKKKKHKCDSW